MYPIVSDRQALEADTYSRGRPRRCETAASVEEMQRVLMVLRVCIAAPHRMTLLAVAEAVGYWFEQAGLPSPVPPIDYDAAKLAERRLEARLDLEQGRPPDYDVPATELAVEVAARTHQTGEEQAALRKLRRLIREAEHYEYALLGLHEATGREQLPPLRQ